MIAAQLDLNERIERSQADLAARSESLLASEVGRQSAEADLKSIRADLLDERKTSELREQFIGVLGHDLRNPLASIAGGMRVLLKDANSERAPDIAASIQKSVMRMAGLVDNIMDFRPRPPRRRIDDQARRKRATDPRDRTRCQRNASGVARP
ncbi:histidine kinase dimerization/phospho-acceptor domain-containing protein [Bradyrhizobium japonicum]